MGITAKNDSCRDPYDTLLAGIDLVDDWLGERPRTSRVQKTNKTV